MQDNNIRKSIVRTLCYSDIFDFPLTASEICKYYIGRRTPEEKILLTLSSMAATGEIGQKGKYYYLNGKKKLCQVRSARATMSRKKMLIAKKASRILSVIPFIKVIGISGSLSMNNADRRDDIDIFIITADKALWITRFFVNLLLSVNNMKRSRHDNYGIDKICPNMFVADSHLLLPANMFVAHEIAQLKFLLNRNFTYEKFIVTNRWVSRFLPNFTIKSNLKIKIAGSNFVLALVNRLFYQLQYIYMKKGKTTEKVSEDRAFFHPRDKTNFVAEMYKNKCRAYLKLLVQNKKNRHRMQEFVASAVTPGY